MKSLKPALLLAFVLFAMTCFAPRVRAGEDASDQLNSEYPGKILTLRHFYSGKHLLFQTDGLLVGHAEVGPWTVDGQILVQTIEAKERTLRIRGRRVGLIFDSKYGPPHDVLEWLAASTADDRSKREEAFRAKDVDIEIQIGSENSDAEALRAVINAVFLAPGESMRVIVPDFWRGYFEEREGHLRRTGYAGTYYLVKKGEVSAPRQISNKEPEFSEYARLAKYQGTMTVSLIVDSSGTPKNVAVVMPLGLGLDEKAVEAVRAWRFEPAIKDGQPVAVAIMVEVDFHLY